MEQKFLPGNEIVAKPGAPPPGTRSEDTVLLGFDTAYWASGAVTIDEQQLFAQSSVTKTPRYRSFVFDTEAQKKNMIITGLRASHIMEFAALGTAPSAVSQMVFEEFSLLEITLREKKYPSIPLAELLPYKGYWNGSSVSHQLNDYPYYTLPEPIIVPEAGNIDFNFSPLSGYTTGASNNSNPQLPGLGLTSNYGFFIKFYIYGKQRRAIA